MVSICRPVAPPLASKSQSPRGNFQIPREERKNPHVGTKHFLTEELLGGRVLGRELRVSKWK